MNRHSTFLMTIYPNHIAAMNELDRGSEVLGELTIAYDERKLFGDGSQSIRYACGEC